MMITIHGLAPNTKYQDVKLLIKQECNIDDYILDNLVGEIDGMKKVRVGLPDDNEGYKLMKCLNGYRMAGNYILKVTPVGKPVVVPNIPPQGGYDSRPGYQIQQRNDYPNQPRSDYMSHSIPSDYNRGPHTSNPQRGPHIPHGSSGPHRSSGLHGSGGPHGSSGPHGSGAPHGSSGPHGSKPYGPGGPHGSMDNVRPSPWAANSNNPGQWTQNPPMAAQVPQNTFHYSTSQPNAPSSYGQQHPNHPSHSRPYDQARQPAAEQAYGGYPPKSNVPPARQLDLHQNLRNIELTEGGSTGGALPHGARYPPSHYQQDKPGPTQYNISHPGGHQPYQHQPTSSAWQHGPQTQQPKPVFLKSSTMVYEKPFQDRKYPLIDQPRDPKELPLRPDTYKEYEKRRGFSPPRDPMRRPSPGRREDPMHREPVRVDMTHRRISPPGRMGDVMPRRISPGRREDPHGMRYSPSRKRVSPGDRRVVPGQLVLRRDSPHKRLSPSRRLVSPRRDERPEPRYSPGRHHPDKIGEKYVQDIKDPKKVRPAYELVQSHAQNQAMYSGGYRPSTHEGVQYPASGMRQEQSGPWQRQREEPIKKQEEERRDVRIQMVRDRERIPEQTEKRFSPTRKSRSPNRRDRSPLRDRYKRNSPSPRSSYSPRRSWALEKRRSPDAPPPPVWPGQSDRSRPVVSRPNFPEKEEKPKHQPVWETRPFKEDDLRNRRPDDRRPFDEGKPRLTKDLMVREPAPLPVMKDQYQREPKFSPRDDYEARRDNYPRRESPARKHLREEFDLQRRLREGDGPDDYNRRRESPRHERKQEFPKDIDKDFEDIYNRAVQFKKKTEEMRKSGSKKRDDFDEERRDNEKDREEIRQRFEERARYREEESLRQREREERREDRPRDDQIRYDRPPEDRVRHDDDRRGDYRPRDIQQSEQPKAIDDNKAKRFFFTNNIVRQKRDKAIDEIIDKMIQRHEDYKNVQGEQKQRIVEELKLAVARIVYDMFGDADVSFIEIIVKYQAKYNMKDEAKILEDVMRSLPKQFRIIKRHAPESTEIPAKISRFSPSGNLKQEMAPRPKLSDSNFNVNLAPPSVISMPSVGGSQSSTVMNQTIVPMMVPAPFYQATYISKPVQPVVDFAQPVLDFQSQSLGFQQQMVDFQQPLVEFQQAAVDFTPSFSEEDSQGDYNLYLCKDNFDRITVVEGDLLKNFLITQMYTASETYQGWSPDVTFKGLQSLYRYELLTRDVESKNWLLNLDFSDFNYFNVLVYTKEELWYERAAIWLPGHSRVRNIEPLDKLKLQNKKLEGVNIAKWKFVKKVVNEKGTRLYVDMPPSSARALEGHGMKLSYELQQVSVFPKAAAVDKDSFDAGLKELPLTTPSEIAVAIKNFPMPSLTNDPSLVKIILKGSKTLSLVQARKIKEVVIYNLFQYHQNNGISRTDFAKYGFLQPNFFAISPLNQESKKWLLGCSFGKVDRQAVVVIGGEEDNTRFFKMQTIVPQDPLHTGVPAIRGPQIVERLKNSNQGVKGINFSMWKSAGVRPCDRKRVRFEVEMDMESLETLSTMKYQLDYVDATGLITLYFRSGYSQSGLEELIKKYKAEMTDKYDVANMELESDESDVNDDVICLD